MRIYGKARVGIEDATRTTVFMSTHHRPQAARLSTADIKPVGWFPIAEASNAELAAWLAAAINAVLDGAAPAPRPEGEMKGIGGFRQSGISINSWNPQHPGHGTEVAWGETEGEVRPLVAQLNALLETRLTSPDGS